MLNRNASPPKETDVVIIGAGIAGISTAWFLNKAGLRVTVCDKGEVAAEQSSRNWGWIRQQGRDESELPIVMESMRLWEKISTELDIDIGYRREGSLYLCENEADLGKHERFLSLVSQYGLKTSTIGRQRLGQLISGCPDRWTHALYTPDDGRAEPGLAVAAMARICASRGVQILQNCAVERLQVAAGRIESVVTERGLIRCHAVECSAGAWSTFLLKSCGVVLPQLTVKATVARTASAPLIFNGNASGSQIAFRRRLDGGYTVAATDCLEILPSLTHIKYMTRFLPLMKASMDKLKLRLPGTHPDGNFSRQRVLDPRPSSATVARIRAHLDDRLPALRDIEIIQSWSGMIDALPDAVPVMDRAGHIEGLWISTGFSGHGFGIGPAAGKIMANRILGNPVEYDLSRFRLSRFTDGSPIIPGPSI